ncbi:MAG: D-alanine--D-alanine ligase [Bacteroidota bacterium]
MKKNIALLTGGYSEEYEISVKSGKVIASHLDPDLFHVYLIKVEAEHWIYSDEKGMESIVNLNDFSLHLSNGKVKFDAAFIGIHGTPGEDGKIQGYLDMMQIPYNTCGRATSALTFNKYFCNEVVGRMGVKVAKTYYLHKREELKPEEILKFTGLPCFVKPNSNGSSIGISKVKSADDLLPAIQHSFIVDDETLIQEFIPGTEITCGIYEKNGELVILPLTQIVSHKEWFDYEAKYTDGMADEISPAPIDEILASQCRDISAMLYRNLNCRGIVRFDFILTSSSFPGGRQFYFLEVNTIPGLSEASIVPRQAASVGISLKQLFSDVLNETLNRH